VALPNTIIIGAQKAGSTSLYDWIGQHPDVYAPKLVKDTHFFSNDELYNKGLHQLANFYPKHQGEKIVLAGDVNYIFHDFVAKRLYDFDKDLKLILILRNPVERAKSAYYYFKQHLQEEQTFEKAIEDELSGKLKTVKQQANFAYLSHGYYYEQLQVYLQYFKASQVKILIFEQLINDKERHLKSCFSFLEIDPTFIPTWEHKNKTGEVKLKWLSSFFIKKNNIKEWLKKWTPYNRIFTPRIKAQIINIVNRYNTKAHFKNPDLKIPNEILEKYRAERKLLSHYLKIDLTKYWEI